MPWLVDAITLTLLVAGSTTALVLLVQGRVMGFHLVRGPVPHVQERFILSGPGRNLTHPPSSRPER